MPHAVISQLWKKKYLLRLSTRWVQNQVFFYCICQYLVFVLLVYSKNEEVSILPKLSIKKSVEIRYQNYCFDFLNVLPFKILMVEVYATMLVPRSWLLCPNYEKKSAVLVNSLCTKPSLLLSYHLMSSFCISSVYSETRRCLFFSPSCLYERKTIWFSATRQITSWQKQTERCELSELGDAPENFSRCLH